VHRSVLAKEAVELLSVKRGGVYVDATVGNGGHAELILRAAGPEGRLIGIDRDEEALRRAEERLRQWTDQCIFVHQNFAQLTNVANRYAALGVDGIIIDLGVSSEQLESAERGFSFLREGPLDMRMDRSCGETAADLVNNLEEDDLREIISRFGEERNARRIARAVVKSRVCEPIRTTTRLAGIVMAVNGGKRTRIHPATRTFQALRIAVNGEMDALREGLEAGLEALRIGGKLAAITFHSLEDRIVKTFFKEHAGSWESQQAGGRLWRGKEPAVALVTRKPVKPSRAEVEVNRRSRTAKLRVAEKIEGRTRPGTVEY
jgi:16S rRNA (cytosine1402-N4)-methyltransferase